MTVIRLPLACFPEDEVVGTGSQTTGIVEAVERARPGLVWWVADVDYSGVSRLPRAGAQPVAVGSTAALLPLLTGVDQFTWGVFCGVDAGLEEPRFRDGGVWTEDPAGADLADVLVEVRAFDATFFEITTSAESVTQQLRAAYPGAQLEAGVSDLVTPDPTIERGTT